MTGRGRAILYTPRAIARRLPCCGVPLLSLTQIGGRRTPIPIPLSLRPFYQLLYSKSIPLIIKSRDATRHRDLVFNDLDVWTSDLIAVSRIELEVKPQYLEMIGMVVRDLAA